MRNLIGLSGNGVPTKGSNPFSLVKLHKRLKNPSLAILKFLMMTGNRVNPRQLNLRLGSGDQEVASEPIRSIFGVFFQVSRGPLTIQSPK